MRTLDYVSFTVHILTTQTFLNTYPFRPSWDAEIVRFFPFSMSLVQRSRNRNYDSAHRCVFELFHLDVFSVQSELRDLVKVLSFLEACFDLISSPSLSIKIQIMGGKITDNLGFKSPLRKVKIFVLFPFPFQILHKKLYIFVFNLFWISCFTNHISIKTKIFNKFYLISN